MEWAAEQAEQAEKDRLIAAAEEKAVLAIEAKRKAEEDAAEWDRLQMLYGLDGESTEPDVEPESSEPEPEPNPYETVVEDRKPATSDALSPTDHYVTVAGQHEATPSTRRRLPEEQKAEEEDRLEVPTFLTTLCGTLTGLARTGCSPSDLPSSPTG